MELINDGVTANFSVGAVGSAIEAGQAINVKHYGAGVYYIVEAINTNNSDYQYFKNQ
ncbi:hypothetical protein [Pedobacter sp. NJ-S-72]